ncbi:MAG: hypothetical protein A2W93_12360 [Bacteroidetes bacterium GWF2_43_63]|nr:MAG: hypothetical protein A2W94_06955 [Bacteroidetes bacterium GWE2_42_42]OFY56459.1 MAG: hypothetical protein A2W93_12360 [Bacteroidetes bacterium GWF2_43_63]HBG71196.1 hypothetical protein [Bacteroidales bacterium]HCB61279.1 hypothetical protein [Bacteroidales bacterium]HCY23296.1 hypothetical protein [Bacteroidales bacterium]
MKLFKYLALLLVALFPASCVDDNYDDCETQDCVSVYPTTGTLTVKVTPNSLNSSVPIQIFAGHYDDGELIREDTLYSDRQNYVFAPGIYYSVAAKYQTESGEIIVVDGDKIEVVTNTDCDSVCYSVNDATVNCKLHY